APASRFALITGRPAASAAAATGVGVSCRFLPCGESSRVTTATIWCLEATRAERLARAALGLPAKTIRRSVTVFLWLGGCGGSWVASRVASCADRSRLRERFKVVEPDFQCRQERAGALCGHPLASLARVADDLSPH